MSYQGRSPNVNRLRLNPRSSDPVNPLEGDLQYADGSARAEGLWTYKNGAWESVGSANGAKNYVLNGNFEGSGTTGFSLSHSTIDATTKVPNQASGSWTAASGNLSIAQITSGQLAGRASISYVSSAATTVGDMLVTDAFTIDKEDQAKPLTVKFYYEAFAGTANCNFSGTSANSFSVQIYDVTNSVWIQPAGTFGMTQGTGVGYVTATFQTSATGTQYRLAISNANATSGAATIYMDDFFVGPQTAPLGYAGTDLQSYTPIFTGFGTVTGPEFQWRQDGDCVELFGSFVAGTPTATEARVSLPSGKVSAGVSKIASLKVAGSLFSGGNFAGSWSALMEPNVSYVTFGIQGSANAGYVKANGSAAFATGVAYSFYAKVPIAGWSSNVQLSSDTDTRAVALIAPIQNPSGILNGSYNTVIFSTVDKDTHGAYNASTGLYTVPVSGFYKITCGLDVSATFSAGQYVGVRVGNVTKSKYVYNFHRSQVAITNNYPVQVTGEVYADAGDTLSAAGISDAGTPTYTTALTGSTLSIERLSGPATIAESASVACKATGDPASATAGNPIIFPSKSYDLTNSYDATTGLFTAPMRGVYRVHGALLSPTSAVTLNIYVQGSLDSLAGTTDSNGEATFSGSVLVNGGQTISLRPGVGLDVSAGTICIERIK